MKHLLEVYVLKKEALINYFILDSNAFNNVDWNKVACNESLDLESNSSNQELNLKLNSDLDLDDLLKVKET